MKNKKVKQEKLRLDNNYMYKKKEYDALGNADDFVLKLLVNGEREFGYRHNIQVGI